MKKFVIINLFCLLSLCGPKSYAGIPTTDYANLAAGLYGNLMEMFNFAELMAMFEQYLDYYTKLMGEGLDADNNADANSAARLNKTDQDIQNLEILMAFQPSPDACLNYSAVSTLETALCGSWHAHTEHTDEIDAVSSDSIMFSADDERNDDYSLRNVYDNPSPAISNSFRHYKNKELVDKLRAQSPELFDSDAEPTSDDIAATYLNAGLLIGGNNYTLTEEQYELGRDYIYLVAPPYESVGDDYFTMKTAMDMVTAIRQNIPQHVLSGILSERYADNGDQSKLEALFAIVDEKFMSDDDINESFIAKIASTNLYSPDAVMREMAYLLVFQNMMSVEKYERSLKRELIKASRLANTID